MHLDRPWRLPAALVLLLTATLARAGWLGPTDAVDCLPEDLPAYTRPVPDDGLRSVTVFLHGLLGDGVDTWTYRSGVLFKDAVAWPCLLATDREVFGEQPVYLAQYHSRLGGPNPTLDQVAQRIVARLRTDGVFRRAHVSFVVHSMGGIVLAKMMTSPQLLTDDERERIRLVAFYATPATSADAARACELAQFINSQCAEIADAQALAALWRRWDAVTARLPLLCVAERPAAWRTVVSVDSAYRPCSRAGSRPVYTVPDTIEGLDHAEVVKPRRLVDRPHELLRNAYAACVKPLVVRPQRDTVLERDATEWFGALRRALPARDAPVAMVDAVPPFLAWDLDRYWVPQESEPSYRIAPDRHQPRPAQVFSRELDAQRSRYLDAARIDWVQRVARWRDQIDDGQFGTLLADIGPSLRPNDLLLALVPGDGERGRVLMLLRPTADIATPRPPGWPALPAPAAAQRELLGRYALLGVLLVPDRSRACPT